MVFVAGLPGADRVDVVRRNGAVEWEVSALSRVGGCT
jgi:hypothetical protein